MILAGRNLHQKGEDRFCIVPPAKRYEKDAPTSWAKMVDLRDAATRSRFEALALPVALAAYRQSKNEAAA